MQGDLRAQDDQQPPRHHLLDEAIRTITQDRNEEYGAPEPVHRMIGEFWSCYLRQHAQPIELEPHDVAVMMILAKVARLAFAGGGHRDSWADIAGYSACGFECFEVGEKKTA